MQTDQQSPIVQRCRHCGGGAPHDGHFCPHCDKILSVTRHGDYFSFLGFPRRLLIDSQELDQRLRALSRQFHPDFFCNASSAERLASLERSSYLNDAYRTLKSLVPRIEYLLRLEGLAAKDEGKAKPQVPPALLEEVFALNEELEEIQGMLEAGAPTAQVQARLEQARRPIERKRADHERQLHELAARWDELAGSAEAADERRTILTALHQRLLERNYIMNLLATIARESDGEGTRD